MARSQLRYNITDAAGNAVQNALCYVYETGTTTAVADLYLAVSGGSPVATLTSNARGEIVGYLTTPRLVDVKVTDNGDTAFWPSLPLSLHSWTEFTETVAVNGAVTGGGGAVDSVNGDTGVVVLDAADVGADAAGTAAGLVATEAGLRADADALLTPLSDARLTNARTPTAHATSHQDGGTDELALDGSQVTTGTIADGRIASTIARDTEVTTAVGNEATARDVAIAAAIANLINSAPGALDTLDELAAAMGDDANFATTVTNALALKAAIADVVLKTLFDANSILIADTDNTPAPLVMGASTILARLGAGGIVAATPAQLKTLLAIATGDVSGLGTAATHAHGDYDLAGAADAKVSDTAYAGSWDGVTDKAPSKNTVYDKIEALRGATVPLGGAVVPAPLASVKSPPDRYLRSFSPAGLPPDDFDVLWRQDDIQTYGDVIKGGGKLNGSPTATGYLTQGRLGVAGSGAAVVGGQFLSGPSIPSGANIGSVPIGVMVPIAGLVPNDEFTLSFKIGNFSGSDFASLAKVNNNLMLAIGVTGGPILLLNQSAQGVLNLNDSTRNMNATLTIAAGWANNTWRTFTIRWRRSDDTLSLQMADDYAGRAVAAAAGSKPSVDRPFGADRDIGFGIYGGTSQAAILSLYVADMKLYRYCRGDAGSAVVLKSPPKITVDVDSNGGAWPTGFGGVLGVYSWTDDTLAAQQLDLTFQRAGVRFLRSVLHLDEIGLTGAINGTASNFVYDWTAIDHRLDLEVAHLPAGGTLLITVGRCPANLGATASTVPSDFGAFARIARNAMAHIKARYPTVNIVWSFWNEPEVATYWAGTLTQIYSLWKQTQELLIAEIPADPSMRLGSPEYAGPTGHQDFCTRLGADANTTALKAVLKSISAHNFSHNLNSLVSDLETIRGYYTAIAISGTIPIYLTEFGLQISRSTEIFTDATSWVQTQPNQWRTAYFAAYAMAVTYWLSRHPSLNVQATGMQIAGDLSSGYGDLAVMSESPPRPRPILSTHAALAHLSGNKLTVTPNWPNLVAVGARNGNNVAVAFGSYRPWMGYHQQVSFDFEWVGTLPATYTWRLWTLGAGQVMQLVDGGTQETPPQRVTMKALDVGLLEITGT
jgi:hypothetical protein